MLPMVHILGTSNWTQSWTVYPSKAAFVGIIMKKVLSFGSGVLSKSPTYHWHRFGTSLSSRHSRYITNELDRKDPSDIFFESRRLAASIRHQHRIGVCW